MFIFGGISAFIAVSTGEGAEEIAESLKRNHDLIHEHEETAETFALLSYILALFSAVALWINWEKTSIQRHCNNHCFTCRYHSRFFVLFDRTDRW